MPDEAEIQMLVARMIAAREAHLLAKREKRKKTPVSKPWSLNMFKEFAEDDTTVRDSSGVFYVNNSWKVSCQEIVGVMPCTIKRWSGNIWFGNKLVAPGTPGSKTMGLFLVRTNRRGDSRHIVSDGLVWADAYRSLDAKPWVTSWHWWGNNNAKLNGWRLVDREKKVPLTKTAKAVIRAAYLGFGDQKPLGNLLDV